MELTMHQKQLATLYSIISAIVQDKNTPEILKIGILNTLNEQLDIPEAGFVEDEETYLNLKPFQRLVYINSRIGKIFTSQYKRTRAIL